MRRNGLWRSRFPQAVGSSGGFEIGSRISRTAIPLAAVLVLGASPFQMGILNGGRGRHPGLRPVYRRLGGSSAAAAILIAADLGRAALLGSIPLPLRSAG